MLRVYKRKPPGRPKMNKLDPNFTHMRVSHDLKALLESEIQGRETLSECCLRLLRQKGKKVIALRRELEDSNRQYEKLQKLFENTRHVEYWDEVEM